VPKIHRPKKGSRGYSPRKRANSPVPRFNTWPECAEGPRIQGFAGYKAGMTHAFVVDYRPTSNTANQEVQIPVTVVETPPMRIAAVRFYGLDTYGLKCLGEVWTKNPMKDLRKRLPAPKENHGKAVDLSRVDEVRLIVHTQPKLVTGVPKKVPDVMEVRVGGGSVEERAEFAKSLLGKEITITDFASPGQMIDVAAITKGKGFQGHRKRWGVKLLSHKNSKHRRMIGTLGPKSPGYVRPSVPQAGQVGYHQRTEYNKRVLKIGESGEEITPAGGFLHYGKVNNQYILLHGSVPGPTKRLVRFRDAARYTVGVSVESPDMTYISTESKQGV
jgi:large subunit ribosomal protein L3